MITIDLIYQLLLLIPPHKREQWFIDYMSSALAPVIEDNTAFVAFFEQIKYELQFSGQTIYLEHVLNDQFDPNDRQIYIEDSTELTSVFLFNQSENNEETYIFNESEAETPTYLYNTSEQQAEVDFIVYVPAALTYDLDLFKYWVNKYRIAPKRWKIETI